MLERHNARTVEVRYRKEPDAQKILIIDATALEPGEVVVVVVTRDAMLQRRFTPDGQASLSLAVSELKKEARSSVG